MFTREHTNFLLQCCKRRRFGDGAKFLTRPLRVSLYRLRRRAASKAAIAEATATTADDAAGLDGRVHGVFAPLCVKGEKVLEDGLLAMDVDAQLRGVYRLAGGAYRPLVPPGATEVSLQGLLDSEDVHCWHRLYWAGRFARAAAAGHEKALDALIVQLTAWLDGPQKHCRESQAAYTLAERICSIAEVLFWTAAGERGLPEALTLQLKSQSRRDARLLTRRLEYHLGVHNHLLNDARGLYAAAEMLPECEESTEWRRAAFGLWEHFFPLLLLPDGTLAEQSSHYHLLLCRTALEYVLAARSAGRALPDGMKEKFTGMFRLANDLVRPDGTLPRFGDNSPDHMGEELWGLMAAAHSHGLLEETPRHSKVTMLTRYYARYYEGSAPEQARVAESGGTRLYEDGGFGFLRSADGATEVAIHANPQPAAGAHGDSGIGSFEVWRQGQVIIREPGCYLGPSCSRAAWFRSAEAQNVTSVEDLGPAVLLEDQRRMPEWYWGEAGRWQCPSPDTLLFESNAFSRLQHGMKLARRWTLGEAGELLFEEALSGRGAIGLRSRLFLGEGHWKAEEDAAGHGWLLTRQAEHGPATRLALTLPRGLTVSVEDAHFTPEYGVEHPAQVVVWSGRISLPCRWSLRSEFSEKVYRARNH